MTWILVVWFLGKDGAAERVGRLDIGPESRCGLMHKALDIVPGVRSACIPEQQSSMFTGSTFGFQPTSPK